MIAYVDSSVVLRMLLREPRPLLAWTEIKTAISSSLVRVECLRTLDRLRLRGRLDDAEAAAARASLFRILDAFDLIETTAMVLDRAAQSMPIAIGTLDSIHLATALLYREGGTLDIVMATHDASLGMAASALGFDVIGP